MTKFLCYWVLYEVPIIFRASVCGTVNLITLLISTQIKKSWKLPIWKMHDHSLCWGSPESHPPTYINRLAADGLASNAQIRLWRKHAAWIMLHTPPVHHVIVRGKSRKKTLKTCIWDFWIFFVSLGMPNLYFCMITSNLAGGIFFQFAYYQDGLAQNEKQHIWSLYWAVFVDSNISVYIYIYIHANRIVL